MAEGVLLDKDAFRVHLGEISISLHRKQGRLLAALGAEQFTTYEDLIRVTWHLDQINLTEERMNTLRVTMSSLRKRVADEGYQIAFSQCKRGYRLMPA